MYINYLILKKAPYRCTFSKTGGYVLSRPLKMRSYLQIYERSLKSLDKTVSMSIKITGKRVSENSRHSTTSED